ncbi:MAG TPA: DUF2608 domain-containing protein [Rickettsia endosymbiont of Pyrocoelia pectoralis]|nr:DUF2608 domain-containing protein [Rickettsia endosymbiont of Pyrocoelia pectoralis]
MMKVNRVLLSLLLCLFISNVSYGEIPFEIISTKVIPTYSINSVTMKKILPEIDKNTLILINIDDTIITPKSKLFRYNDNSYINFTKNLYSLAVLDSSVNATIAELIKQRQMMLVEKGWVEFVNKAKQQGAMVLGLNEVTAPCNLIENYEGWLYTLLYGFNINFTDKVNDKDVFRFNPSDATAPIFYLGIIFTGSNSKVKTLMDFLKMLPQQPTKIIIFSSDKKDLENINTYLRMVDIEYYGIEYLGWQQLPGSPDDEVVKLQQSTLLNTGKWLEDEEASQMLNK